MNTFNFSELTPDLILDAIESQGMLVESGLLTLNSYENRVYQFIAEDKKRYVAKFTDRSVGARTKFKKSMIFLLNWHPTLSL